MKVHGPSSVYANNLVDFLAGQKNLEKLSIKIERFLSIEVETIKSFHFTLTKLTLGLDKCEAFLKFEAKFLLFMSNFSETLEELSIRTKIPSSAYEMIFMKFIKLKTLIIDISYIPIGDHFIDNIQPNRSVLKFGFGYSDAENLKILQGIIRNLPNVETLVCTSIHEDVSQELMAFSSNNLRNLKNFEIDHASSKQFNGVHIPCLKSITIGYLCSYSWKESDWEAMIGGTPNIEYFSVSIYDFDKHQNMPRIINRGWTHLRHIKLMKVRVGEKFKLLIGCKELETIELEKWAFDETPFDLKEAIFQLSKQNGIRFI